MKADECFRASKVVGDRFTKEVMTPLRAAEVDIVAIN